MTVNATAHTFIARCEILASYSEESDRLTRRFASNAMRQVHETVKTWMHAAGMTVEQDNIGNLIGRYEESQASAKTLLLGSHLDTVRDAGKYDGPLGVLVADAAVQHLRETGVALPFHIEIAGFSDEEGVRYQTTYLGSRALAGTLSRSDLARIEEKSVERARR